MSLAIAASPWLFPSLSGLIAGFGLHAAWFTACEKLASPPGSKTAQPRSTQVSIAADRPLPATRKAPSPASRGFVQTPVLATLDEAPGIRTFRILRPAGFTFEAGQFLTVRLRVDGKEFVRCYSISSAPHSEGFLEISVKRQGVVSGALHATARPGAILTVKAPNGKFCYPSGDDRPIALFAGGIGITPLISMLRHAVHAEPTRRVTLLYSATDIRHLAFYDELQLLSERHPQIRVCFALTREAGPGPAFYPGRIDAALVQTAAPFIEDAISFICGPTSMIESMRALLAGLGVPPAQIRYEAFEAAIAASRGAVPSAAAGATRLDDTTLGSPACAMRCLPVDHVVPVESGQSVLEAAEAGGVDVPSLCRAGVCGTCRVRVTSGDVVCESIILDASEREQGFVLACVAHPQTDCTVHL